MSDAVSFAELDGQYVELLPARTVLSMFSAQISAGDADSTTSGGANNGGGPSLSPVSMLGVAGMMNSGADGTSTDGDTGALSS
ncbi:MAG: hypothetical protein M3228_08880 [Actinomycetota bacterium]|nr:hypothetical protein [Actinomycetota bacterium]